MADTKLWYARDCIQKFYDSYGERARQAERNEGIDWKAVSHAFRAGYQLKEIYETGDLKYPLKDAQYILEIKQGKYHYQNDNIAERLESLIAGIESLCAASKYPDKADREFWDEWLVSLYK
jgi:DnaJ-domain-containing protein 1